MYLKKFNCDDVIFYNTMIMFIILPAVQLIMTLIYYDNLQCLFSLNPYMWLLVDGLLGLINFILLFIASKSLLENEKAPSVIINILDLIEFIKAIWLFIGSMIFWDDYVNLMLNPINVLFFIKLIFSWTSVLVKYCVY